MNKVSLTIWGRIFEINVIFDCYAGETPTITQQQALKNFIALPDLLDSVRGKVEKYCKEKDSTIIVDNIFKFVIPQTLFVQRTKNNARVVGVMCAFKLDLEHGMAIVFKNEKFDQIGAQDVIL